MNLQQIDAVCAVARQLSISSAADSLNMSQSGLSRQLKELELELGVQVFLRTRNKVVGLTPQGVQELRIMQRVASDIKALQQIGSETSTDTVGEIRIATTHVYARHILPKVIKAFGDRFPAVALALQQSDPVRCCESISRGDAEIGIVTLPDKLAESVVAVPAYQLPRCVIAPRGHPLTDGKKLTLARLAKYPIITYPAPFSGRTIVMERFAAAGLAPRIVCSATDADVSKAYVELGMGVAILAKAAVDKVRDRGLVMIEAGHLFPPGVLNLVFRKNGFLTRAVQSFVSILAPHIKPAALLRAVESGHMDRAAWAQAAPVYEAGTAKQ